MSCFNLGPAVSSARVIANDRHLNLSVGHAQQILASLFGCNTYAALLNDEKKAPPNGGLGAAEHFILNPEWGIHRCRTLSLPEDLAACCFWGAKKAFSIDANPELMPTCGVFGSVEEFWEEEGRSDLIYRIYNDDHYSGVLNELNHVGYLPDGFDLDHQSGNFWQSEQEWIIHARGTMDGELGDDEGSIFAMDDIDLLTRVTYRKAGRAGLILRSIEIMDAPGKR